MKVAYAQARNWKNKSESLFILHTRPPPPNNNKNENNNLGRLAKGVGASDEKSRKFHSWIETHSTYH